MIYDVAIDEDLCPAYYVTKKGRYTYHTVTKFLTIWFPNNRIKWKYSGVCLWVFTE